MRASQDDTTRDTLPNIVTAHVPANATIFDHVPANATIFDHGRRPNVSAKRRNVKRRTVPHSLHTKRFRFWIVYAVYGIFSATIPLDASVCYVYDVSVRTDSLSAATSRRNSLISLQPRPSCPSFKVGVKMHTPRKVGVQVRTVGVNNLGVNNLGVSKVGVNTTGSQAPYNRPMLHLRPMLSNNMVQSLMSRHTYQTQSALYSPPSKQHSETSWLVTQVPAVASSPTRSSSATSGQPQTTRTLPSPAIVESLPPTKSVT